MLDTDTRNSKTTALAIVLINIMLPFSKFHRIYLIIIVVKTSETQKHMLNNNN